MEGAAGFPVLLLLLARLLAPTAGEAPAAPPGTGILNWDRKELAPKECFTILAHHNRLRSKVQPPAANMQKL
ncbi:hypothetical protein chiPu_0022351, partial [Chiloscyllium punctatum]|nr:hypothetical protein [Chiloscyllium punctatum]